MFDIKSSKDRHTSREVREAQKNFADIEKVIGKIMIINTEKDLDKPFKTLPEKSAKTNKSEQTKKLQAEYMDPQTKKYMKAATLPSPDYWNDVEQKTQGSDTKTSISFNKTLQNIPFTIKSFKDNQICLEEQEFFRVGIYIYTINTEIEGLNKHLKNSDIFFVVSPTNGYKHRIPNENRTEKEYMEKLNEYGRIYLIDVINHVKKSVHQNTRISCFVLGEREVNENMNVYDKSILINKDNEKKNIKHYYFSKENSGAETDIFVHNIDMYGHKMSITSSDLDDLHETAVNIQKKDGTGEAVIVHCQQGIDRTGMLIFSWILFEKYNHFFNEKFSAERIYQAYKILQQSRSPGTLAKMADFVNAIFLSHTFKAIDIEKNCISNIGNLILDDKKLIDSRQYLVSQLPVAKSNSEKLSILKEELKNLGVSEYTSYKSPKRGRARSLSCNNTSSEALIDPVKKSSSEPGNLNTNKETQTEKNIEINSSLIANYFNEAEDQIKNEKIIHHSINSGLSVSCATRQVSPLISELKKSKSDPVDLHMAKGKSEKLEACDKEIKTTKSLKSSGNFFEKKILKRHSTDSKEAEVKNIPKNYITALYHLMDAIQHRINTEYELQNRVQPTESLQFTII